MRRTSKYLAMVAIVLSVGANAQEALLQPQRASLVVSQNADGQIRLADASKQQAALTGVGAPDYDDQVDERVVRGLWQWLEEKKRRKKEGKRWPLIRPVPKLEKKVIHIHINNQIKKEPHGKHGGKKHHRKGHYESYHHLGDHHDHYHDKHYPSKHFWPLLGHHYYGYGYDDHDHHHDHHHEHDHHDYHGHASTRVLSREKPPAGSSLKSGSKRAR